MKKILIKIYEQFKEDTDKRAFVANFANLMEGIGVTVADPGPSVGFSLVSTSMTSYLTNNFSSIVNNLDKKIRDHRTNTFNVTSTYRATILNYDYDAYASEV